MSQIPHLTNRNGIYHFRRSVPKSLRSLIRKREIVLTLNTKNFPEACIAVLEISDELSGLFKRLEPGQRLLNPADQSIFATEITRRRLTPLLIEALETFSERKPEDIEWEAFHCREYRQQVQKNGLLVLQKGKPWFSTNKQVDDEARKLSEFKASDQLIKICEDLGYAAEATQSNAEGFVELRTVKSKKRITYTETPYSTYTNELMSEYCELLNQHQFEVDGEGLGHIHLVRKYSDWDGSGELKFGGRTWLPYMQFGSAKRSRIKIDGKPVRAVDYPASQLNVLYKHITGEFLQSEDPYTVTDAARDTVKYLVSIMLNNASPHAASLAANNEKNLKDKLKTKTNIERYKKDVKKFGSVSKLMTVIAERNAPIAECFLKGKAKGQEYAWLEANLVFEVARRLARSGVPALTVHDEFIVPEGMEGLVWEFMYTTSF